MCDSWDLWDGGSSLQGPNENCKWNMRSANSTSTSDVQQLTGIVHNAAECVRSQSSNGMSGQKFVESESVAVPPPRKQRLAGVVHNTAECLHSQLRKLVGSESVASVSPSRACVPMPPPITMPPPIPFILTDLNGNYINSANVANKEKEKDKSDVQQLALSGLKPVGSESVLAAPSGRADILPLLADSPPVSTNNAVSVDNEGGGKQAGSDSVLAGAPWRACAPRTVMAETSSISPGTVNSDDKEKQKEKSDFGQLSVGGVKQVGSESVLVVPPWRARAFKLQKEKEQAKGKGNGKGKGKKDKGKGEGVLNDRKCNVTECRLVLNGCKRNLELIISEKHQEDCAQQEQASKYYRQQERSYISHENKNRALADMESKLALQALEFEKQKMLLCEQEAKQKVLMVKQETTHQQYQETLDELKELQKWKEAHVVEPKSVPLFRIGQSCHQYWAKWFKTAEKPPTNFGKKNRQIQFHAVCY